MVTSLIVTLNCMGITLDCHICNASFHCMFIYGTLVINDHDIKCGDVSQSVVWFTLYSELNDANITQ